MKNKPSKIKTSLQDKPASKKPKFVKKNVTTTEQNQNLRYSSKEIKVMNLDNSPTVREM